MKKLFWCGLLALSIFEIGNIYFIMPMPGSQRMNSIDVAYFLYKWRWMFRALFGAMILAGLFMAAWRRKWLLIFPVGLVVMIIYMANFSMAADAMFRQPRQLLLAGINKNKVDSNRLVIGVSINNQAKAYPVRFMGYHHHIQDTVGGQPVLVTYCTVCRTGRVFEPVIDGKREMFRLVGMDHFNAMLEDATTKSWWRQETGEAIAGKLKGKQLPEIFSTQTSLAEWLTLHPNSLVMQPDPAFINSYDTTLNYENGRSRKSLTGTDSLSWKDKSWVIGIKAGNERKAYDWNELKEARIIEDDINGTSLLVVLANDDKSFFAFEKPAGNPLCVLRNDTIICDSHHYRIDGKGLDTSYSLRPLPAYQEFWHSWRTFNSATKRYQKEK